MDDPNLIALAHTQAGTPWAWYIVRAAGIASLILLILVMIFGIGITTGWLFKHLSPTRSWWWHRALSISLMFAVIIHVGALLFDHYIGFNLTSILIPFKSTFKPVGVAWGILGFYIFWPVILSSLYWVQTKSLWWRLIHYTTFVMIIAVYIHSITVGTDTKTWPLQLLYWSSGMAMVAMTIYRLKQVIARRT